MTHIDFETYSEAGYLWTGSKWVGISKNKRGLEAVGTWNYSTHPSTEIISLSYGKTLWVPGQQLPADLFMHILTGGLVWAWNSFFEWCIWNNVGAARLGWPRLPLEQTRCAMATARGWALPGKLEKAGEALQLDILKDKAGHNLIRKLCMPRNPTKNNPLTRLTPQSNPGDFQAFYRYNLQDVAAETAIHRAIPPLSQREQALWLLDQRINARGVQIDREGLENCISIFNQAEKKYTEELKEITHGQVNTVSETAKMCKWLQSVGCNTDSVAAERVGYLLDQPDLNPRARRLLQIRQILSSASVKKLFSIKNNLCDDSRLRNIFSFCGADRTGRFSGLGPQPHNMPGSGPPVKRCGACGSAQWSNLTCCRSCGATDTLADADWGIESIEMALADISTRDLSWVEAHWGDPLTAISGCLRGLFTAPPGNELISSDFSAIEAVVLAALAGEEWRLEVFRTHGKIYEMSASKITGVPFEDFMEYKKTHGVYHPLRKKIGKVAELASGYNGWIGAWKNFGADKFMDDDEIKRNILKWRDESPAIVEFWGGQVRKHPTRWQFTPEYFGLEGAAVLAILNPGQCYRYRSVAYGVKENVLYCQLPSGRLLAYHRPSLEQYWDEVRECYQYKIRFWGWNTNTAIAPVGWMQFETYSGKLAENVAQATARDILTHGMPLIERAGYSIVLHVHDELCSEVPLGFGSVSEYEKIMATQADWFADWPVKASGGWRGMRYRK